MIAISLILLGLVRSVLADGWVDFSNNIASDLAPIITLFGEQLSKKFLSESTNLLDNIIFALLPIGV
jgi:ankyrin repeat domain-containing protein 50